MNKPRRSGAENDSEMSVPGLALHRAETEQAQADLGYLFKLSPFPATTLAGSASDALLTYIQDSIFFLSGTPPACTTLPSMTTPGVDMTP